MTLLPVRPPAVVALRGEVDVAVVERLRLRLREELDAHPAELVVDLSECTFLDACSLGALLDAHSRAERQGARLLLRGACPRVRRVLALTGLLEVLRLEG